MLLRFALQLINLLIAYDHFLNDVDLLVEQFHKNVQLINDIVCFEQVEQIVGIIEGCNCSLEIFGRPSIVCARKVPRILSFEVSKFFESIVCLLALIAVFQRMYIGEDDMV